MCHSNYKIQHVIFFPLVTCLFNMYQEASSFQFILIVSFMTVLQLEYYNIVENLMSKLYILGIKSNIENGIIS